MVILYKIINILLISNVVILMGNPTMLTMHNLQHEAKKQFDYNPEYELLHSKAALDHIMITCHGSGANKDIGHYVAKHVKQPIITFNFPDHDMDENFDLQASSFGTIDEYLPLIFLLQALVKNGTQKISLYGFSAGGGAIINALTILNSSHYNKELLHIGVGPEDAQSILKAISQGIIILDAPLKSVTEILSIRPNEEFIQVLSQRFKKNGFESIDRIEMLNGLTLSILLYFEKPDEILSNRDDELYYQKLKAVNIHGTTHLITGHDGGHNGFHKKLWDAYKNLES